jgi:hypothetical protein
VDWGPRFSAGDSLGVRVSPGGNATEVTFFKNGASLGTGFQLAENKNVFYPCLHVSGQVSLSVEIPQELPSTEVPVKSPCGLFGVWQLKSALDGESPIPIPDSRILTLKLEREGSNSIKMAFKIGNQIRGNAKIVEDHGTSLTIDHGHFLSTRMMPPPDLQPIERLITTKKMTTLSLEDNNTLILSGPELRTEWSHHFRVPEALQSY